MPFGRRTARQSTGKGSSPGPSSTQQEIRDFLPTLVSGDPQTPSHEFIDIPESKLQLYTGPARNIACPLEGELATKLKVLVAEAMKNGAKMKDGQEVKRSKDEIKEEKRNFSKGMFEVEPSSSVLPCDYCHEKGTPCTIGIYDISSRSIGSGAVTTSLHCLSCQKGHKTCSLLERYMAARLAYITDWEPHVAYSLVRALRKDKRKPYKKSRGRYSRVGLGEEEAEAEEEEVGPAEDEPAPEAEAQEEEEEEEGEEAEAEEKKEEKEVEESVEIQPPTPRRGGRKRTRVVSSDLNTDGPPPKAKRLSLASTRAPKAAALESLADENSILLRNLTNPNSSSPVRGGGGEEGVGGSKAFVTKSVLQAITAEGVTTSSVTGNASLLSKKLGVTTNGGGGGGKEEPKFSVPPRVRKRTHPTRNLGGGGVTPEPMDVDSGTTTTSQGGTKDQTSKSNPPSSTSSADEHGHGEESNSSTRRLEEQRRNLESLEENEKALREVIKSTSMGIEVLEDELRSLEEKERTMIRLVTEAHTRLEEGGDLDHGRGGSAKAEDERVHALLSDLLRESQGACSMLATFDPNATSSANPNLLHGAVVSRLRTVVDRVSANLVYI